MAVSVECPNCSEGHEAAASGHVNIVCTSCKTEFSVVTKHNRVVALAKVHRAKKSTTNTNNSAKERPFREHEHVGRPEKSKYQTRALWFALLLLLVFLIQFPQPILLVIIGILVIVLFYDYRRS